MSSEAKRIRVFRAADVPKMYRNMLDSYHGEADLLAELLQNALDSIRMSGESKPQITVVFDPQRRRLTVRDNGLGMSAEDLEHLALGKTKKPDRQFSMLGGEKGIGSAYIFGGSDCFYIETCHEGHLTIAECKGAYNSIMQGVEPDFLILEEETTGRTPNYTEIQVEGAFFYMDYTDRDELEHLLRTYTAVGQTKRLFNDQAPTVPVRLTWRCEDGEDQSKDIANHFQHPILDEPNKVVDYGDAEQLTDGSGRFLSYVDQEREVAGLFGESSLFDKRDLPKGVFLSVKGYPTAVEITPPRTGSAGYWSRNVLIVVNYDDVVLDAGRKAIPQKDKNYVKSLAKDVFNALLRYQKRFVRQTEAEAEKVVLESLKEEARQLENLNIADISFCKKPDYEQAVLAIFHELIGAGRLQGYHTLQSSQDTPYDEIMYYERPFSELGAAFRAKLRSKQRNVKDKTQILKSTIVVEYKLEAHTITRDRKKNLGDINLLVAYDCATGKLKSKWKFEKLNPEDYVYDGARYELRNPMNEKCYVLLLRDFVGTKTAGAEG